MCPAEASVGVDAKAVVRGIQREDKNIMGTLHFGLRINLDVGGSVKSKIHMDGVILHPTLYVDGVKRIDKAQDPGPDRRQLIGYHRGTGDALTRRLAGIRGSIAPSLPAVR